MYSEECVFILVCMNTNNHTPQKPNKILLALYLFTLISLLLLGIGILPGCGGGSNPITLGLPGGTGTQTLGTCNAGIVDTLSKMQTPSFNNGLGVPDTITHYPNNPNIVGESEVSYSWIAAKTTMTFQWNITTGQCTQMTQKG